MPKAGETNHPRMTRMSAKRGGDKMAKRGAYRPRRRTVVLRGRPGFGPPVEGEVLVSRHGFSARYDLDRNTGVFSREAHDLYGQSLVDKVGVFATAKGGVATAWALLDMKARGVAPKALIFGTTNPIMVQGAVLAGIPILHRLTPDPTQALRTGDRIRIDPSRGRVTLLRGRAG